VSSTSGRSPEAPVPRASRPQRIVERTAVAAYRGATWLLGRTPAGPTEWVVGTAAQASYLLWPSKRRSSNANFGHILGLPPDDRRVRRLALRAYRAYARYLVELIRLPLLSADETRELVKHIDLDHVDRIWRGHGRGLIMVVGHMGSNDALGAGIASRGWPLSVPADDSSFPELFEDLRRSREAWGVKIVPWRNLRQIYASLRRHEMVALLVDWGYRPDGIPVRLGDAWTNLPPGPAVLAARTGATLLPIASRRDDDGFYHADYGEAFTVASTEPAEIAAATQRIADGLALAIRAAPEQWYSFKPLWPESAADQAAIEARGRAMLAGDAAPAEVPADSAGGSPAGHAEGSSGTAPAPEAATS
jgi:KDO2-lipid IV(A) lauroyltransferase